MPIYLINIDGAATPAGNRLVRAGTRSQATGHIAKELFASRVATQDDLVEWVSKGVKVEDAGAEVLEPEAAAA